VSPSPAGCGVGEPVDGFRRLGSYEEGTGFELYDSFATRRFGGNVAGVVVSATTIAPCLMQQIAGELGAPTTGFAHAGPGQPVTIRFFTPRQEIGACGHVSVAVATALAERSIWRTGDGQVHAITPAGPLSISLRAAATAASSPGTLLAGLAYQPRLLRQGSVRREAVEAALAMPTDPARPIEMIGTGLRRLVVPAAAQQALARLAPSEAAVDTLAASCGADTVCVFTRLGEHRARMRDLCAPIGALEEPASGTTSAALAAYLTWHAAASGDAPIAIEQGVEMGRPSRIEVHVQTRRGQTVATVSGSAIKTASGTIFLAGK
jgi:trans-2,3-dihydro-3-hydroxyanthranilate isomerase